MSDKINPVRETDEDAIQLAQALIHENRYAALAVREEETGVPLVSRVAIAYDEREGLFFCASDLSVHSKCLLADPVCSFLLGEPGKGDGLAYPRITVIGKAVRLPNDHKRRSALRAAFLKVHPKAELYIDFADFGFYPIAIERAQLNGGFGKAYHLDANDMRNIVDG